LFFNEVISVLNTSSGQTEKYSIPLDQRIYVLEDIDCQSDLVMNRALKEKDEKEKIPEKLDLSFLLNILDGVLEIPGRIVIMTSNYIDKLDHALIRPGRIDVIADFKKCVNTTILEMIEFFYDIKLCSKERDRIMALIEYMISPAEMGKIMFENFNDFRRTIETLEEMDCQTICLNDSMESFYEKEALSFKDDSVSFIEEYKAKFDSLENETQKTIKNDELFKKYSGPNVTELDTYNSDYYIGTPIENS
jgi:hypothetical protein